MECLGYKRERNVAGRVTPWPRVASGTMLCILACFFFGLGGAAVFGRSNFYTAVVSVFKFVPSCSGVSCAGVSVLHFFL